MGGSSLGRPGGTRREAKGRLPCIIVLYIKRKRAPCRVPALVLCCVTGGVLLLVAFGDGEFTAIVAALGAYVVIHNRCAAVAAGAQLCGLQRVVRSSFGRSRLRESVFWMWHIITFLIYYFNCFSASHRGSMSSLLRWGASAAMKRTISGSHSPSGCTCCRGMRTATYS